ncbi:MAG TPA: hypothetical protein VFD33_05375, partial [Bacillota bacterium]|nr:hypothetical protein [Bacillota bacterium]
MYGIDQKVSYLRGLVEGMGYDKDSNEGKLFVNIIDILDDMAESIVELETTQIELDEYVETIDEDLSHIEDEVYDIESFDFDDKDDLRYIEVECPHCLETVYFDDDMLDDDGDDDIICPSCTQVIYSEEDEEGEYISE